MILRTTIVLLWGLTAASQISLARDIYVHPQYGDDKADGLAAMANGDHGPCKTIARGLKLAGPGDTVHLVPLIFKESAVFYNREGEPEKPIVLDGHGAILEGSEPLQIADWQEASPGLFRNDNFLKRLDDAILQRWYFLFDGRMNHMGRTSKGKSAPLKKPEELEPGEWTFVRDPTKIEEGSTRVFGSFYVKLAPGKSLADARIAAPMRSAGVQMSGRNSHLVIRNLTATHVYNDGFNIHGYSRDCLFQNIRAIECGDDGISSHEDCQYRVDGFVSIGNSTGICDTGDSVTDYRRVFIRDCLGYDLFFLDTNRHSIRDAVVLSSAARTLTVTGRENQEAVCSLALENVYIRRVMGTNEVRVAKSAMLDAKRTTFIGLNFNATGGEVKISDSIIGGEMPTDLLLWKDVKWTASNNIYDIRSLRYDKTPFAQHSFADFQKLFGQDAGSRWQKVPLENGEPLELPKNVGAEVTKLLQEPFVKLERFIP